MTVTNESTLKELVDETGLIKNDLVNCRDNLKNNLSAKKLNVSNVFKMSDLVNKVKEIDISVMVKPNLSEEFFMERVTTAGRSFPFKKVRDLNITGTQFENIPYCYQFSSKTLTGIMTSLSTMNMFKSDGTLVSSCGDFFNWTRCSSDYARTIIDGKEYITTIGNMTSSYTMPLYHIDTETGSRIKKADLSIPSKNIYNVRYSKNLVGVHSYYGSSSTFSVFTKKGESVATINMRVTSGVGQYAFLNDEYLVFIYESNSSYWYDAVCISIADGKSYSLSTGGIKTSYGSEPLYTIKLGNDYYMEHSKRVYKITNFSSLAYVDTFPISANFVSLNDYMFMSERDCYLFPKISLFYHEKLVHYDAVNGFIYTGNSLNSTIEQYKFDTFSR